MHRRKEYLYLTILATVLVTADRSTQNNSGILIDSESGQNEISQPIINVECTVSIKLRLSVVNPSIIHTIFIFENMKFYWITACFQYV